MCPTVGTEPNPFAFVTFLLCVVIIGFFCILLAFVYMVFEYIWPVDDAKQKGGVGRAEFDPAWY